MFGTVHSLCSWRGQTIVHRDIPLLHMLGVHRIYIIAAGLLFFFLRQPRLLNILNITIIIYIVFTSDMPLQISLRNMYLSALTAFLQVQFYFCFQFLLKQEQIALEINIVVMHSLWKINVII